MNIPDIPNNSITEEIKEIIALCEELEAEYGKDASWFSEPVSETEIAKWECENKIIIPESYKEWLMFSGDSQILNNTARFFGLKIIGTYGDYVPNDYVVIGELVGDGELLCFSKTTNKIVRYNHGKSKEYQNFKEILNLILNIV